MVEGMAAAAALIQGMSNQKRQPAGQPIGGQFATTARAESQVPLAPPARSGPLELTFDQLRVGDEFIDHSRRAGEFQDYYLKVLSTRPYTENGHRYQRIEYETRDGRRGTGDYLVAYPGSEKDARWPREAPKATVYGKRAEPKLERDFDDAYESVTAPSGESYWEADEIKAAGIPDERVWTAVDADDGGIYAVAGWMATDRVGHLVSKEPWKDYSETYVVLAPDDDICQECGADLDDYSGRDGLCGDCVDAGGCDGHESLDGAHMGETVYCDGSCRS